MEGLAVVFTPSIVSMDAFKFQVVCVVLNPPAVVVRNACTVACLTMKPSGYYEALIKHIPERAIRGRLPVSTLIKVPVRSFGADSLLGALEYYPRTLTYL